MIDKNILNKKAISVGELKEVLASVDFRKIYNFFFVKVSPSDAKYLLQNHTSTNRDIKRTKVAEYKSYMEKGIFNQIQGDTISFDIDGNLSDGQHRLTALAEADESKVSGINLLIITGTNRSEFKDIGVKRNTLDALKYNRNDIPEEYSTTLNAAMKFISYMYGVSSNKAREDENDFFNYLFDNHLDLMKNFAKPMKVPFNGKIVEKRITEIPELRTAHVVASLFNLYALKEINDADLAHIANVLHNGLIKCNEDATLIKLRDVLANTKCAGSGDKMEMFKTVNTYIRAWKKGKIATKRLSVPKELPVCFNFGGQSTIHILKES